MLRRSRVEALRGAAGDGYAPLPHGGAVPAIPRGDATVVVGAPHDDDALPHGGDEVALHDARVHGAERRQAEELALLACDAKMLRR